MKQKKGAVQEIKTDQSLVKVEAEGLNPENCGENKFAEKPLAITISDCLKLVGFGKSTCYVPLNSNVLRSITVGTRRLILMESVDALLSNSHTETSTKTGTYTAGDKLLVTNSSTLGDG